MGDFFNFDGPLYKYGNMLADILILSVLWILFSIPVITIGASTTALYFVMLRRISEKEGYIISDFWKSFKMNFKLSTIVWLIILVLYAILYLNITNIETFGNLKNFILPVQFCSVLELTMITIYIFPIISRFDMKIFELFKSAFLMANKHIFTTILCLAIFVLIMMISFNFTALMMIFMGVYSFITSFLFMRIFKIYRPEIDLE